MSENVSRRKMLSCLVWGRHWLHAFGSAAPLVAEAQGSRSGHSAHSEPHCARHRLALAVVASRVSQWPHGAAIAVSDATAAMSDDTRAAPVNLLRPPPHQLQRNSGPRREVLRGRGSVADVKKDEAYALLVRECSRNKSLLYQLQRVRAIREGVRSARVH